MLRPLDQTVPKVPEFAAVQRRQFVSRSVAALAAAGLSQVPKPYEVSAMDPIQRQGPTRTRLSLAAYSFRRFFGYVRDKPQSAPEGRQPWSMMDFIDYCVAEGFDAAELTAYFFEPNVTDQRLSDVRRHAFLSGMPISGTAIGNDFTVPEDRLPNQIAETKRWIDRAATLGAPHIRIFAGTGRSLRQHPERLPVICAAANECGAYAAENGIFLGIENHGDLTIDEMLRILEGIDHPWVGMNVDTGNFFSETPYDDVARCMPYAVNVQFKSLLTSPGRKKLPVDFERMTGLIRDSGYQGYVALEYEEENPLEEVPKLAEKLRNALE